MFVSTYLERKQEKPFLLKKTPSNAYCFQDIINMYPDAKIIHMIRDGRDVYCSLKKRNINPFLASSMWLYNSVSGMQIAENTNYLELKYEDLVTTPQQTMERVCKHIEVPFTDNIFIPSKDEIGETTRRGFLKLGP